jgi:hypothetical protein
MKAVRKRVRVVLLGIMKEQLWKSCVSDIFIEEMFSEPFGSAVKNKDEMATAASNTIRHEESIAVTLLTLEYIVCMVVTDGVADVLLLTTAVRRGSDEVTRKAYTSSKIGNTVARSSAYRLRVPRMLWLWFCVTSTGWSGETAFRHFCLLYQDHHHRAPSLA